MLALCTIWQVKCLDIKATRLEKFFHENKKNDQCSAFYINSCVFNFYWLRERERERKRVSEINLKEKEVHIFLNQPKFKMLWFQNIIWLGSERPDLCSDSIEPTRQKQDTCIYLSSVVKLRVNLSDHKWHLNYWLHCCYLLMFAGDNR